VTKGAAERFWIGALCLVLILSLLPLSSASSLEESEARMAAPAVFVLEQPVRKTLAPLLRHVASWLALGLILTIWAGCRQRLRLRRAPPASPRPLLYSFGKLQLEGG
jgi:hypothetical protein